MTSKRLILSWLYNKHWMPRPGRWLRAMHAAEVRGLPSHKEEGITTTPYCSTTLTQFPLLQKCSRDTDRGINTQLKKAYEASQQP